MGRHRPTSLKAIIEDLNAKAMQIPGKEKLFKAARQAKSALRKTKLRLISPEQIFTNYYRKNTWGDPDSKSGPGSNLEQTAALREALPKLFSKYEINSILDAPCGDFFWFNKIELGEKVTYTGADIVKEMIEENNDRYGNHCRHFIRLDLTKDRLPSSDLIIIRDCLVHLSFRDINSVLGLVKESGSQYLLTTHFANRKDNHDIATGEWRPLNMLVNPFNFPEPVELILERCTEGGGAYADKSMALWKIEDL